MSDRCHRVRKRQRQSYWEQNCEYVYVGEGIRCLGRKRRNTGEKRVVVDELKRNEKKLFGKNRKLEDQ